MDWFNSDKLPWKNDSLHPGHTDQHHQGTDHTTAEGKVVGGLVLSNRIRVMKVLKAVKLNQSNESTESCLIESK